MLNSSKDSLELEDQIVNQLSEFTKEDLRRWVTDPITKLVLKQLAVERLKLMEDWENGKFYSEQGQETLQKNAQALGASYVCREIRRWIEEIVEYGSDEVQRETGGVSHFSET